MLNCIPPFPWSSAHPPPAAYSLASSSLNKASAGVTQPLEQRRLTCPLGTTVSGGRKRRRTCARWVEFSSLKNRPLAFLSAVLSFGARRNKNERLFSTMKLSVGAVCPNIIKREYLSYVAFKVEGWKMHVHNFQESSNCCWLLFSTQLIHQWIQHFIHVNFLRWLFHFKLVKDLKATYYQ